MNWSEIVKGEKDQGKEEHIPNIMVDRGHKEGKDIVRVVVGHETPHPNTVAHHIAWIELYGVQRYDGQFINLGRASWAPVYSNPNVRFQVNQITDFRAFCAIAYCTLHGLWGKYVNVDWIVEEREDKPEISAVLLAEN